MAIALSEHLPADPSPLGSACEALAECAREVGQYHRAASGRAMLQFLIDVERASRIVDHLQVLAARLADEHHRAGDVDGMVGTPPLTRTTQVIRMEVQRPPRTGGADPEAASMQAELADDSLPDPASADPASADPVSPDHSTPAWEAPQGIRFRSCADFLRATLGISHAEAKRRLRLAEVVLPGISPTGAAVPPRLGFLGAAVQSCRISGRAATTISQAMQRVQSFATLQQFESMERHLTRQAMESDEDVLRVLARRWESVLDQDGQEPSEKVLRARQGVFLKGRRHGLHFLEIGATDEQFEHLATVMNSTANPRVHSRIDTARSDGPQDAPVGTGPGLFDDPNGATRPQALLDGLVSACKIALATASLPSSGGHRPQVMVTIDYKDLIGDTQRAGHAVFTQQLSARNIRTLACDADIIPLVLGSKGQVLDIGRAQRLFPPHLRRALVARDKGCAFPDCSIPASWCEAHHMKPWSRGGATSISNGVLLCSRHHHVIHQGSWTVEPRRGIPWFSAPGSPGRAGNPRRNRYWQAGQSVHEELSSDWSEAPAPLQAGRTT